MKSIRFFVVVLIMGSTLSYAGSTDMEKCLKEKKIETGSLIKAYQICSIKSK